MSAWVYEALYRLLFVLHAACAAYVAGGTAWLSARGLRGLVTPLPDDEPLAATLRDWLPFVLGLAITFGVGPLLFVQLLDGEAFYTANLLLSHRFMALLPALIVGFYLLYVQKTEWSWVTSRVGRFVVPFGAFLCFGFTAWSWSENHLLSLSRDAWTGFYARGPGFFGHPDLLPRLLVFAGVALQAVVAGLTVQRRAALPIARLAGVVGAGVALVLLGFALHPPVEGVTAVGGPGGLALGVEVLLLGLWIAAVRRGRAPRGLTVVAVLVVIERVAAVRALVRAAYGGTGHVEEYASAQGFVVFVLALVAGIGAILFAVWRVRRDLRAV